MIKDSKSKLDLEAKTGDSDGLTRVTVSGRKAGLTSSDPLVPFTESIIIPAVATTAAPVKASTRPLYEIAREIRLDWSKQGKGVNYAAKPYLDAMADLSSIKDNYGYDSAKSIVLYFLANASSWRGETAKRVKAELKALAGGKR